MTLATTATAFLTPVLSTEAKRNAPLTSRIASEGMDRVVRRLGRREHAAFFAPRKKCTTRTTETLSLANAVTFDVGDGGSTRQQQQEQSLGPVSCPLLEEEHIVQLEGRQGEARQRDEGEANVPPTLPPAPRLALPLAAFALEAALWPELVISVLTAKTREARAYMAMARPWNLLPSMLMVFCGAAAAAVRLGGVGGGGMIGATTTATTTATTATEAAKKALALSLSLLASKRVWHAALSTAAIALGSMVVNDYFDVAGDRVNAPTKPLPSGLVPVDGALLFGGALYLSALVAAAWLEPKELRLLVACSAAVTLAYTPLFKKIPVAKTTAVAGVVALSPLAGALAVAGVDASSKLALSAVAPACLLAFFSVAGREILMDAADARGDGAAGVPTLPLLVGRRAALSIAAALEGCAAAVLASRSFCAAASSARASSPLGRSATVSVVAASLWLGSRLVSPAAAAARAALVASAARKRIEEREVATASSLSKLSEAEAAVSAAIKRAVDGTMKPAGAAVIAALLLG